MEDQFHNENIINIKCQSQHSPRPDLQPELRPEELYIQYQSNICVVKGQPLFENLKRLRSQLVKDKNNIAAFKLESLCVRKWGFKDQSSINDVAVIGLNLSNSFDHLLTASTCGGFDVKYRSTPPNSTLVLAAGSKPFLGYHYALEGVNQAVLSDVAKVVTTKLKSALPGWLTGAKANETKEETIAMQPVDNIGLRFGLCDLERTSLEIFLCPNKKLAAISDYLGRVLLIDCFKGIIVKVFKGYREAQCAFIQVPDERRSKHRLGSKVATFLLIYSSKKGTLEIFTIQQGTKIATFSASKHSRLLYVTHGLMGFTQTSKSRYVCPLTTAFLDGDGAIREIFIPFHFALAEKNSIRARDIHLYKKIRQLIKTGNQARNELENEIFKISTEIKMDELKMQTLDMLLKSKDISSECILKFANYFLDQISEEADKESQMTTQNFRILCRNVRALAELYLFATLSENSSDESSNEDAETPKNNRLNLDSKDLELLQKLLDLATSNTKWNTPHVRFSTETFSVTDFLSSFDMNMPNKVELRSNLDDDQLFKISEVLFKNYISGKCGNLEGLSNAISNTNLTVTDIFNLLIQYWVNRSLDINLNLESDMYNFFNLVDTLVKLVPKDVLATSDNISPFWETVRENLANNSRPFPALMAAMLCKNVQGHVIFEDNIEVLTKEIIQWSFLIGKLQDVSTLNIILSNKPHVEKAPLPKLTHEQVNVSLKYILQKGRGSVSELTAQWLTSCGIDPQYVVINEIIFKNSLEGSSESDLNEKLNEFQITEGAYLDTIEQVKSEDCFKFLNILKQQFPYSLEASNLLVNMCWEYALAWRKEITNLEYLRVALTCLYTVPDRCVKDGLYQLIWNTHLKILLENSSKLINKVGKLPKYRLCQQDTGLSDKEMTTFIGICMEFINSFLETVEKSLISNSVSNKPELKFEELWENDAAQPLIQLALHQKNVEYNLLHLHYQLCMVLHMITKLGVKHSKPIDNLFEGSLVNLFFTDLQRESNVDWSKSDFKIDNSRFNFLTKIITSSIETVTFEEPDQIYCKQHVEWMEKCLELAGIWNLGVDSLKRFQIVQLYISGFDILAQELIPAVSDCHLLGEELLKVAANRLSQFLNSSPNLGENFAAFSPFLSRYMMSLSQTWCSPSSLHSISLLGKQALILIGENQKELSSLAELLLDACNTLESIHSGEQ
ncbi:hypothetical protein ABEB36_010302 [Hypothenemus hampei]